MLLVILNLLMFVWVNVVGSITGTMTTTTKEPLHFSDIYKMKTTSAKNKASLEEVYSLHILCIHFPRNTTFISYLEWGIIRA